ncbi:uncharacterized protein [Drosophila tropicalis]|uniref:uncharacterized protein isoform X2 n=1 Tax=Drosophila tropicalis TaxID=46794 RepID=UPI0035ABD54F
MGDNSLNISQISISSQLSNEEEDAKCFCDSYTHDDLKKFLVDSSLKNLFLPYVHEITLAKPKQLENGFNMIQLINWQHLDVSGRHAEMFMVIKSFGLIINCRRMREACPDRVGTEIREYFLKISKSIDHSSTYGMMVERYIAYCVVRGVCTSNTTPTDPV